MRPTTTIAIALLAACGKPASGPGRQEPGKPVEDKAANAGHQQPAFPGQTRAPHRTAGVGFATEVVVRSLEHPWSVAFLPDGRFLITERPGRLRIAAEDGTLSAPIEGVPKVDARDQGGLLDVLVDREGVIFLSYSEPREGGNGTAVARARLDRPALRLDDVCVIFSYGHRNIQAAALHPTTHALWVVDHGARGGDEVNIVKPGKNYGWPTISYGIEYKGDKIGEGLTAQPGLEQPLYYWDPVIAPSGMAFYDHQRFPAWRGSLFVGGLAGKHLVRLTLDGDRVVGEERLLADRGKRIRDVRVGADGAIYVLTDEADGELLRLVPREGGGGQISGR
jgi:glucose/arabinose dehydrogenase